MEPEDSSPSTAEEPSTVQTMEDIQPSVSAPTDPISTEQLSEGQTRQRGTSGSTSSGPNRKRKPPAFVTPNACTSCKKARAKCDGARPACKRCVSRNAENGCHYEPHAKTAKEQMVREIRRLQRRTEELVEENEGLEETNSWIEQIMASLKENGNATEIIKRLKRGDTHEAIATWLQHPEVGAFLPMSPSTERKLSQAIEQIHRDFAHNLDSLYWTSIVRMPALVEHLIKLYLTWIHPVHMLFDEDHFMHSFRTCSDVYCSPSLVNVICAMACHLLHDTCGSDPGARESVASLRNQFLDETKYWLQKNLDYSKTTTIQTYAIMFMVDLGCGHGLMASSHLRLAVENLLSKKRTEQSSESEEITTWGIITLHTAWSGFTYQKPSAPISTGMLPLEREVNAQTSDTPWQLYTVIPEENASDDDEVRMSHALETASEHAKLFRIVHENILVYCGSRAKVSAQQVLRLYERYLAWREGLSGDLSTLTGEPLPHVLLLHVQYHTVLIHLLHPLLHAGEYNGNTHDDLRRQVLKHAHAGLTIIRQHQSLYSAHFLTPLHIFCTVHLCDVLVRYESDSLAASETAKFCLISLEDMRGCYPLAGPMQQMFRQSLRELGISIPDELERRLEGTARMTPDQMLDACTRLTYIMPFSQITANLEPGLGQSFMDKWGELAGEGDVSRARQKESKQMDIGSLLNRS